MGLQAIKSLKAIEQQYVLVRYCKRQKVYFPSFEIPPTASTVVYAWDHSYSPKGIFLLIQIVYFGVSEKNGLIDLLQCKAMDESIHFYRLHLYMTKMCNRFIVIMLC